MRRHKSAIIVCFAVLLLAGLTAQTTVGRIQGAVKDRGGAALPGVDVTLTRDAVRVRTAVTDRYGQFTFDGLTAGRYEVKATFAGFAPALSVITLSGAATEQITLTMVGMVEEALRKGGVQGGIVGGLHGGLAAAPPPNAGPRPTQGERFNTETYDKIDESAWTEVTRKPLSTFSIDVDTASYSNVRRFLNLGQLPPKDAVRIEELINYFSYDYPQPRGHEPFTITTSLSDAPWNSSHRLALIGLQAHRLDSTSIPSRNLVFLVDVSGSMNTPQKLPLVRASLAMLARNLNANDRVAIVVYAGAAGLALPPTIGSDTTAILEAIGRLEAGGSTNGGQGLRLAYDIARQRFMKGGVNRVILATDGDFNVGVTNQGDLIGLIEENRESGVALSVLGFGMGNLKDSTMEKLADRGNGNYSYIDTLDEAQKVLVEQAGGTLVTLAKDVKLQIEFNPRVIAAYRLIGYENRVLQDRDFNDDRKDAGELGAGHSVTALYELVPAGGKIDIPGIDPLKYQTAPVPSRRAGLDEAMTVKVRYKQPEAAQSTLTSVAVPSTLSMSPALGFASAVAEFGMLLRGSEHKGTSSFAEASRLARKYKGADEHGHRAEFIRLIGVAESVGSISRPTR